MANGQIHAHINFQTYGVMCGFTTFTSELLVRLAKYDDLDVDTFYFSLRHRKNVLPYSLPIRHIFSTEVFVYNCTSRKPLPLINVLRPFVSYNLLTGGKANDVYLFMDGKIPALPMKGKIIAAVHDIIPFRCDNNPNDKGVAASNMKEVIRKASRIITVSEFSKQDIIDYFHVDPDRIDVVYDGINASAFAKHVDVSRYSLPEKYILYFGSCGNHKNVEALVKAYALLPQELRDEYKLVITNPSNSVKDCAASCGISEHVQYLYNVPDEDRPGIYRNASLFVWPSLYEGFGLPILEAQASGCPVVCSNVTSMPEVAGDSAILFDPHDTRAISSAMERVLTNDSLRDELIAKGYENIKRFSWDESAKKLHDIIVSL